MPTKVSTRASASPYIIIGVFMLLILGMGIASTPKHQETNAWEGMAVVVAISVFFVLCTWAMRLEFDDEKLCYRSLWRRVEVRFGDISAVEIAIERSITAPQGVPRFFLVTRSRERICFAVKPFPLPPLKELCRRLIEQGADVRVANAWAAKNWAKLFFEPHLLANLAAKSRRNHPSL